MHQEWSQMWNANLWCAANKMVTVTDSTTAKTKSKLFFVSIASKSPLILTTLELPRYTCEGQIKILIEEQSITEKPSIDWDINQWSRNWDWSTMFTCWCKSFYNRSELKFKLHILSRTRMPDSGTQPSAMGRTHGICTFRVYHILIAA